MASPPPPPPPPSSVVVVVVVSFVSFDIVFFFCVRCLIPTCLKMPGNTRIPGMIPGHFLRLSHMLLSTASPHLGEESRLYDPEMFRWENIFKRVFSILTKTIKKSFRFTLPLPALDCHTEVSRHNLSFSVLLGSARPSLIPRFPLLSFIYRSSTRHTHYLSLSPLLYL